MKKLILVSLLAVGINSSVYASGIPVFDGAAAANFLQQIQQLRQQYTQLKTTAESLKGITILAFVQQPSIRNYMPADLQDSYDEMSRAIFKGETGSYKGLDGVLGAMEDAKRGRDTWEKMAKERETRASSGCREPGSII